jgi:serine/threonine-protein kinase HipA
MKQKVLSVRLHGLPVGTLEQTRDGKLKFTYLPEAKQAISLSMPLTQERYGNVPCEVYFGGLLPESTEARKAIALKFDANPNNTFSLLSVIGHDCAGAISFHAPDEPVEADSSHHIEIEPLSDKSLAKHIRELPEKPLFLDLHGLRLSLAGVQEKAAVCVVDKKVCLPAHGTPTTHILKPSIRNYQGTVQNEYLCLRTAKRIGLPTPHVEMRRAEDQMYLLVERYDRKFDDKNRIARIHQEDFTQALSAREKYQRFGGPSLKQCFDLLLKSSIPVVDRNYLMQANVFNFLIGNADAHAKNFAYLHHPGGNVRLAPFYDLLCTQAYSELTQDMSMKVGDKYLFADVRIADWEDFSRQCELSFPSVKKTLQKFANDLPKAIAEERALLKQTDFDNEIADKIVECANKNSARLQQLL